MRCTDRRLSIAIAIWSLLAGVVGAQTTGRVEGRLTREDGSGLPGVRVTIAGTQLTGVTDDDGRFALDAVPAGTVSVTFTSGKHTLTVPNVVIGPTAVVDRTLDWEPGFGQAIVVSAPTGRALQLPESPNSAFVVTGAAIGLEAASAQVPKALASVPGVELAQSGIFDFNVNLRGLNAALTRRVLTRVDGRDPASVLIGAQEWSAFGVPVDEISRIEIVRGPASALYGTNAFNGVVDISTRTPRDSQGGDAQFTFGEVGTIRVSGRHAGKIDDRTFFRVQGAYGGTDDFYQSRRLTDEPEYPGLPTEAIGLQRDRTTFFNTGARVDRYLDAGRLISVEGGWARTEGGVLLTSAGRIQTAGAQRPWARAVLRTSAWHVSGYYDGRYGPMASLAAGTTIVDHSMKLGTDATYTFKYNAKGGSLIAGGAFRFQRADTRNDAGQSTILRDVEHTREESVFGQLDQPLLPRLKLVVAARLDDSSLHGPEVSPRAAVVYTIAPMHTVRATYGHAFETGSLVHYYTRTPGRQPVDLSAIETALAPALGGVPLGFSQVPFLALGNENLSVERVNSYEVGYSGVIAGRWLVGANYYYNQVSDLITPLLQQVGTSLGRINPDYGPYQPPSALSAAQQTLVLNTLASQLPPELFALMSNDRDSTPIFAAASYTNFARVDLQGTEVSLRYFLGERVQADLGYSWIKFTPKGSGVGQLVSANAPPHAVTAGASYDAGPWVASVRYRWTDVFPWNGGVFIGTVPKASVLDVTGRYRFRTGTAVVLNIANTLDNEHYEIFGGDILHRRALVTIVQSW